MEAPRASPSLLALPAGAPSLRLLADQTAKLLDGIVQVLAGLALLVDAPGRPHQRDRGSRLSVPDFPPGPHWRYPGFPRDRSGRAHMARNSIARAINVSNAQPNDQGVATVDPIFTWVRLAQRIPVRIYLDQVPPDVILAAGMTVTVQIDPGGGRDRQDVLSRQ